MGSDEELELNGFGVLSKLQRRRASEALRHFHNRCQRIRSQTVEEKYQSAGQL